MPDIPIDDIIIGTRFRGDVGDITQLAESISDIGLLHPIVLDSDNRLIAGLRRIEAYKHLGLASIPYHAVGNNKDSPECEIHENSLRKSFGISEVVSIFNHVKESKKQKPEKEKDGVVTAETPGDAPGKNGKNNGRTRDVVSAITGYSPRQVQKMSDLVKRAGQKPEYCKLLQDVESGKKSVNTAHKIAMREERAMPKAEMPDGIYDVILCDVPIRYDTTTRSDGAADHYSMMTVDELCELQVPAAANAVIFFWMSPSIMYDTVPRQVAITDEEGGGMIQGTVDVPVYKAILDSWGFTRVKGEFSWDKEKMGSGYIVRGQHENCIIAHRGRMPAPAESFPSVIRAPRRQFSRKPDEMYGIIEKMYPGRHKYLELFARQQHSPAWDTYGNQTAHFEEGGAGDE